MKKAKFILGICLAVQSLTFFLLFLLYWNKKRSLAKTFAAFSAVGGLSGAWLIYNSQKEKSEKDDENANNEELLEEADDDFFNDEFDEDDLFCDFEKEEDSEESEKTDETEE